MKINARLLLRRAAVTVAVVGSLVLGAATIRAAGQWTASEAPLAAPPVTVDTLTAQLAAERERTSGLASRLASMAAQTAQLQAGLDAANAQIQKDAATAGDLKDRIAAAKKRLATLDRQIAATARRAAVVQAVAVTRPAPPPSAARPTPEPGDDD
jgi:septal ring factor EnvC (AmiA/AmiB activator)